MNLSRLGHQASEGVSAAATDQSGGDDASGAERTPQLVYQSNSTAIYRLGSDVGVKVTLNPSEDHVLQLVHEHNVSKFLPPGCRKRHVLDVKGFKGDPAIYFRWARGKTLLEWLGEARSRPDVNLTVRLRVAVAVAQTLHEFNDGGVVYNNLTPRNIVLDTFEGGYRATLIDLSEAIVHYEKDGEFEATVAETDLKCLGNILNELFSEGSNNEGKFHLSDDDDDDNSAYQPEEGRGEEEEERKEEPTMRKRGRRQSLGEGIPMYLGALISTLLSSGDFSSPRTQYDTVNDALLDLKRIEKNPQVYLRPLVLDDSLSCCQLCLPSDAFYGRLSEKSMLLHSLNSLVMLGGQPTMVAISGYPGTGKTTLVDQMRKPLRDANGYFLRGKFDVMMRTADVIFSALDTFYHDVLTKEDDNFRQELRSRILKCVGSGCKVLMNSLPNLQLLMGKNNEESNETPYHRTAISQRWKILLCKLIAATSSKHRPLVIALDDLQWADETCLDVIRMMAIDPDIRYCLFMGVYRDNQLSSTKRVKTLLSSIQEQGVSLTTIKIGPVLKECVNTLLSETMCLPPRLCQPLSDAVHVKTGGVIMFVLKFIVSLNDEGLLWFNLSSRRWEFDIHAIEMKEISVDVVEHMSERMTLLPHDMQYGLKLCACLGNKFDAVVLQKSISENDINLNDFFTMAVEHGLLQKGSPVSNEYTWAHDQIQQAAYELIPHDKRESFHLLLGSRLFLRSTPAELENDLFLIVGNMNIGVRFIKSVEQKLEVAKLNLRAGEKAINSSSFNSAAKYLCLGISLLPDNCWANHYDLCMRLYDAAMEATYVIGDFDTLANILQVPILHARCFEDKLSTYHIMLRYLSASGQSKEAISKGVNVLAQLGEGLPEQINSVIYAAEVREVKQAFIELSGGDILNLPMMREPPKLAAMQFLSLILTAAFVAEPLLAPILVFRMVRLSIRHGLCRVSAYAFGSYGAWLVSAVNSDIDGGYRMGSLALNLLNRLDAKDFIARVYLSVYGYINIWKEPAQAGLAKLLEAYEVGAVSGDIEFAISCLFVYSTTALNTCGEDLEMLESNVKLYNRRAVQCNQKLLAKCFMVLHEQILFLMGSSESSASSFDDSQGDANYSEHLVRGEISPLRYIFFKRKFLAFFCGDMDAARAAFELGSAYSSGANARTSSIVLGTIIDGLIAFFFARKRGDDESRWRNVAEAVIDLTTVWATNSPWNWSNKLYLLEAEHHFLEGDEVSALKKYEQSAEAARDHHFIHEEGLTFERTAQFHLHYGRNGEALVCFAEAKKCYQKWGALALVRYIERMISDLA